MLRPALIIILPLALLAACNKSDSSKQSATGRVLEGTVSDAMLPVDTLTSEPPLAEPTQASASKSNDRTGAKGAASDKPSDEGDKPAATATPEADSAAEPAAEN